MVIGIILSVVISYCIISTIIYFTCDVEDFYEMEN